MHSKINRTPVLVHVLLVAVTSMCVIPFFLLVISSFTDETALIQNGYSFFPEKLSMEAYQYLWNSKDSISRAYAITFGVTAAGTFLSLSISAGIAYAMSKKDFILAKPITFLVVFSVLFHPGLVPTYIFYTRYLGIKNSLLGLLIPRLMMNGVNVLILRTYFCNSVPEALLESARLDGANEFRTFFGIVLPISKPILATIGFLNAIAYWNDWFNSFIYISDTTKLSLQGLLNRIILDIQFMSSSEFAGELGNFNIPSISVRMAIAVVAVLPIFVAFPFFQRFLTKGIRIGAVKG